MARCGTQTQSPLLMVDPSPNVYDTRALRRQVTAKWLSVVPFDWFGHWVVSGSLASEFEHRMDSLMKLSRNNSLLTSRGESSARNSS